MGNFFEDLVEDPMSLGLIPHYAMDDDDSSSAPVADPEAAASLGSMLSELMGSVPEFGESTADVLAAYLQYNPELAKQQFDLMMQYEPRLADMAMDISSAERTSAINDILGLQDELQTIQAASMTPEQQALQDLLYGQIYGELEAGSGMTPEMSAEVLESIRSAEAARGLLGGQGSANRESVEKTLAGNDLLAERQNKAFSMLGMMGEQQIDPFLAILGQPSTALTAASGQASDVSDTISTDSLFGNYWNAENAATQQSQYALNLGLAAANPYLSGDYSNALTSFFGGYGIGI